MLTPAEAAKELLFRRKCRQSFWEFRIAIHPDMKVGWWQRTVAEELQLFYEQLAAGLRPKLVLEAPPQHGKSEQITDFIAWIAGKNPDLRTIYTSFSERLGIRANLKLQRLYDGEVYKRIFPETIISGKNAVSVSSQNLRNREIIEYVGKLGYFRNTTVQGSITGESLDLGVIDDPIRGRKDANSETVRNAAWDWFTDDFFTRFSEGGGLLAILTRWHIDDPIGRLLDTDPSVKRLSYPAIATQDDGHRKKGEALFPEHKSIDFLLERKRVMPAANFEALYQQNPYVAGGEIFKLEHWKYYEGSPAIQSVRIYADTAQKTKEQNDYSVFQCWGKGYDGHLYFLDQLRGKWEAPELLVQARAFYNKHKGMHSGKPVSAVKVEDKSSGTQLIQTLKREGMPIVGIQRDIDKVTRAYDTVPLIESGNVYLPKNAAWLSDYIAELSAFPNGKHDDQVDPTMDAVTDYLGVGSYNYGDMM